MQRIIYGGRLGSGEPVAKDRKDVAEILAAVREHGWRAEATSDGYKLYAPGGIGIVLIHKTPSARNWQRKAVSQIRRYDPNFRWKGR